MNSIFFTKTDIDKILKVIQRKVLKGTHLPIEIKKYGLDISTALISRTFINILAQNKLLASKAAIRKVETLAEWYILIDSLVFRNTSQKETAVLAVPETCANKIINLISFQFICRTPGCHKNLFNN